MCRLILISPATVTQFLMLTKWDAIYFEHDPTMYFVEWTIQMTFCFIRHRYRFADKFGIIHCDFTTCFHCSVACFISLNFLTFLWHIGENSIDMADFQKQLWDDLLTYEPPGALPRIISLTSGSVFCNAFEAVGRKLFAHMSPNPSIIKRCKVVIHFPWRTLGNEFWQNCITAQKKGQSISDNCEW